MNSNSVFVLWENESVEEHGDINGTEWSKVMPDQLVGPNHKNSYYYNNVLRSSSSLKVGNAK